MGVPLSFPQELTTKLLVSFAKERYLVHSGWQKQAG
jgi:hypothetical protein